jgi:hypothetical protein
LAEESRVVLNEQEMSSCFFEYPSPDVSCIGGSLKLEVIMTGAVDGDTNLPFSTVGMACTTTGLVAIGTFLDFFSPSARKSDGLFD